MTELLGIFRVAERTGLSSVVALVVLRIELFRVTGTGLSSVVELVVLRIELFRVAERTELSSVAELVVL